MRILFVTSNRLGDAVLSTGLLDHLVRTHPEARFTIACGPVAEGVFARLPRRERTIVVTKQPYGWHWLGLWAAVAGTRWDLVVDLRASALSWLVPTRRRAVLRRRPGHKTREIASVLAVDPVPLPVAWTAPADEAEAARLLPPGRPPIILAPTANWAPKVWPGDRFAALFHALASDRFPDAVPVIMGGPGEAERAMASPLLAALPGAVDLVGRLSIPVAAAVLRRAALFVGNDSGLMHLAASAGAPTIGLFGPTPAPEYAPSGRRTLAVVGSSPRMDAIPVRAVRQAVDHLLDRAMPAGQPGIALLRLAPPSAGGPGGTRSDPPD
jgi:ADP-heptose:LPS heptosyltransferase